MDEGVDQYGWVRMDGVEGQHFSMCLFTPARRPAFAYACFGDLGFAKRAAERTDCAVGVGKGSKGCVWQ